MGRQVHPWKTLLLIVICLALLGERFTVWRADKG